MISLPQVTLCCVDTTERVDLAMRAMSKSMEQCRFAQAILFTDGLVSAKPYNLCINGTVYHKPIRTLNGIEDYSRFVVRELHQHIQTSHALIVQADGYALNGAAWMPEFLKCDYIGSPWEQWRQVGNGGFSLRSKRFMAAAAKLGPSESAHPEDRWLCHTHRGTLEHMGMVYAPLELARRFGFEGRAYNGKEWAGIPLEWDGSFGFHSWLTPLRKIKDRPLIYHHSGDWGDCIYSLPVMKALGGGVLFVSTDNRFPHPSPTQFQKRGMDAGPAFAHALRRLLVHQDYVWAVQSAPQMPFSVDVDLNAFRRGYQSGGPANWESIFKLHQKAFNVNWPEDQPWLECREAEHTADRHGIKDIAVNRTARYHNDKFPWAFLMKKHGHRMVFLGTQDEYEIWTGLYPDAQIPWFKTGDLYDAACVINRAKVFIGNQSSCLAIAHGLGKPVVVEEWPSNKNCHLNRPSAMYCSGDSVDIPEAWL